MTARISVLVTVAVLASVSLASCGDSGASKEEIAAAERHGRRVKAEKEKERRLENAIHELKKEREQEKRRPPVGASAPTSTAPSESSSSSERTSCGGELEVGPDTTCAFAENVRAEYEYELGSGSGEVTAYSEANSRYYSMYCTAAPHECTGAISARVYFP
jgi:hypothetical protein